MFMLWGKYSIICKAIDTHNKLVICTFQDLLITTLCFQVQNGNKANTVLKQLKGKKCPESIYPEPLFEYRSRLKYILRTDRITQCNWFPFVDLICYQMIGYRLNLCSTMLGRGSVLTSGNFVLALQCADCFLGFTSRRPNRIRAEITTTVRVLCAETLVAHQRYR